MMLFKKIGKQEIATFTAGLFHISGFIGLFTARYEWFIANTSLNLFLMFCLVIWTAPKNVYFFLFAAVCFCTGMITEIIGVHTGLLFGNYQYGKVLGKGVAGVPWMIGINWFVVIYCCGILITCLHTWLESRLAARDQVLSSSALLIAFIVDGALLATFFDYLLEPVAVKFGYWTWLGDGSIPIYNFLSWFMISGLLLLLFKKLRFQKHNQFAVHLLFIEILFFAALRTFL